MLKYTLFSEKTGSNEPWMVIVDVVKRYGSGSVVTVSPDSSVYVCGYEAYNSSYDHSFLAKFTSSGDIQWQKHLLSGDTYRNQAWGLSTTKDGSVYIGGSVNFHPWIGKFSPSGERQWLKVGDTDRGGGALSATTTSDDSALICWRDGFASVAAIAKFNSSGELLWHKDKKDWNSYDYWYTYITSYNDSIYVGGVDQHNEKESYNTIVDKFDLEGNHQWSTKFSTSSTISGAPIAAGPDGCVYVCGHEDINNITNGYIAKLDSSGQLLWVKKMAGSYPMNITYVTVSQDNSIYVCGILEKTSFNSHPFIIKFNPSGEVQWQKKATNENDQFYTCEFISITCDSDNSIYVSGYIDGFRYNSTIYNGIMVLKLTEEFINQNSNSFGSLTLQDGAIVVDDLNITPSSGVYVTSSPSMSFTPTIISVTDTETDFKINTFRENK